MNLPRSEPAAAGIDGAPVYRFANVAVDVARQQLRVDEAEVACQPLAFRLLVMLCEARGALVPRSVLFDRLWPGGQDIGDTALTQLIWRLRGALGPAADAIKTVRRGGIRLDAELQVDAAAPSATAPAAPAVDAGMAAAPASVPTRARPRWRRPRLLAGALIVMLLGLGLAMSLHDPSIGAEYDLRASDLDAGRGDTAGLLRLAFAAERAADTGRARELLLQVAELDTRSPVAPALLAMQSYGNPPELERWAALAKSRVRDETPAYTRLLVELARHLRDNGDRARQLQDAMLDLRPNAWRLHHALAHHHLARRAFGKALTAYRNVPLDELGPGVVVYVLGDRASLGDADAVEAELDAGRLRGAPMLETYVRARLAYTRGRYADAIAAADRSVALADAARAYDNATKMAELGALSAYVSGSADTGERFAHLLPRCGELQRICRARTLGFLAVVAMRAGERELAARYLADAFGIATHDWEQAALQMAALQFGIASPRTTEDIAGKLGSQSDYAGNAELLRAWQALADGDRDTAARRLERARVEGVMDTYFAEYALLLGARLGERVAPCRVDPPFPNSLRITACAEVAGNRG